LANSYYADWYAKNKEKLAEKRKKRYHSDPEYRKKVLSYAKRKRDGMGGPPTIEINGATIPLMTLTESAEFIGVSRESMLNWEKKGLLPDTPYRLTERRVRYYTKSMISVVKRVVNSRRSGGSRVRVASDDVDFRAQIENGWRAIGVPI
jgi:predicted DNA-binding transcriptional regulator AlpA